MRIISISDNEEFKHNSLMYEKVLLRAGYSQVMVILIIYFRRLMREHIPSFSCYPITTLLSAKLIWLLGYSQ